MTCSTFSLVALALAAAIANALPCNEHHAALPFYKSSLITGSSKLSTGTALARSKASRVVVVMTTTFTPRSGIFTASSTPPPKSSVPRSSSSGTITEGSLPSPNTPAASGKSIMSSSSSSSKCTFTNFNDVAEGQKSCSSITISGISVPAGQTLDLTNVADGTTIYFEGTTTFGYFEWEGPLLSVAGTNINVVGNSGNKLDGNGVQYWDGKGSNGGVTKPKLFQAHSLTDSSISGLNIFNSPVQMMSINSASNLTISNIVYDNSAGDGENGGHNTDAFDVGSSTGVIIRDCTIKNQDDCLAVNSGTDITFDNNYCSGGHGISIGSVGGRDNNDVSSVTISNSHVIDSDNGCRIKTVAGASGSVKDVTFRNITMSGINKYGIVVEQDYENGSPTGTPTDGVPITDLRMEDISGVVNSHANGVYILCASCSDWTWTDVHITGGDNDAQCEGVPAGASC